jgi:hypothetical protein
MNKRAEDTDLCGCIPRGVNHDKSSVLMCLNSCFDVMLCIRYRMNGYLTNHIMHVELDE